MYLQEAKITDITNLCENLLSENGITLWEVDFNISSNPTYFFTLSLIKNVQDNEVKQKRLIATQNKTVQQSDFEQRGTYKNPKCGKFDLFRRIGNAHCQILRTGF